MSATTADSELVTQLADSRPHFDTALRVAIPVNAPPRGAKEMRDDLIRENAFSPSAQSMGPKLIEASTWIDSKKELPHRIDAKIFNGDHNSALKTQVRDFTTVASSSRRAGRKDIEATAYVSLGVICDNQLKFLEAIEHYKKYLEICNEISDVLGSACACNSLGVNYMLLASPPSDIGTLMGVKKGPYTEEYLYNAVAYHSKHLEVGPDAGGRFVANTNLGLCYGMLGDIIKAAHHHQDALRTAIKMQTLYGQSIAVGNLGQLALLKGDFSTARTCFEQHLQLVQTLQDPEAEITAWNMLAKLNQSEERHVDSLENLDQARRIAAREGFSNELRRVHCFIGMYRGAQDFHMYADQLLEGINANPEQELPLLV